MSVRDSAVASAQVTARKHSTLLCDASHVTA